MKEYFTSSYEQKRKDNLLEINNKYNNLISTYNSQSDNNELDNQNTTSTKIYGYNNKMMSELNKYLDLIESQITILENKQNKLAIIENKIHNLKKPNTLNYNTNISEIKLKNKNDNIMNILLIVICCLLLSLFVLLIFNM